MTNKKTLCGLILGMGLLSACELGSGDKGRELNGDVIVPNECSNVYAFGYNSAVSRYFVSCKTTEEKYNFYSRKPETKDWEAMELNQPSDCTKVYNFGYNYAASRFFVSCKNTDGSLVFSTRRANQSDWKTTRFISDKGYLKGE